MKRTRVYWFIYVSCVITAAFYWGITASARYVSETNIILQSPQLSPPRLDFTSLVGGGGSTNGDLLFLKDYLLSYDMLRQIDEIVDFRTHYSNQSIDYFSRLKSSTLPIEELHTYYLSRISVKLDEYAQVLRVKVEAFDAETAHHIAVSLLRLGEAHMNEMGKRLAKEQVQFLERQVMKLRTDFENARGELLAYQNQNELVSPPGTIKSLSELVAGLESQLANLKAKLKAVLIVQTRNSPEVKRINAEISALKNQIRQERSRMAQQSGDALNVVSSEYQTLELKVEFARDSYSGALAALENTRIEAARKLKQVSVLQSPTIPEYPVLPERSFNILSFSVVAFFICFILQLTETVIREHKD